MANVDLSNYVDVAERIVEFRAKYPDGSLQQQYYEFVNIAGQDYVIFTAKAFRTPDDPCPGVGTAWEQIPGRTPYTRGSEIQNAETSAWGRAIVATLAADTSRGVASAEEVRNRQAEQSVTPRLSGTAVQILAAAFKNAGMNVGEPDGKAAAREFASGVVGRDLEYVVDVTEAEANRIIETLQVRELGD